MNCVLERQNQQYKEKKKRQKASRHVRCVLVNAFCALYMLGLGRRKESSAHFTLHMLQYTA